MKKHTDSGFAATFRGITLWSWEIDGNPQIVEIPGEIDGVPVTELAEYLFSGKSCQVIRIPSGVWKIGRDTALQLPGAGRTWFSSDFTDLGSGAFTGCHKIRRMEVQMNSQESGLKEILSEVGERTAGAPLRGGGGHALVPGILRGGRGEYPRQDFND